MPKPRLPWQQELDIIDRTMKAISGVTDPEKLVDVYWDGIGELIPIVEYLALSRRNVAPPLRAAVWARRCPRVVGRRPLVRRALGQTIQPGNRP